MGTDHEESSNRCKVEQLRKDRDLLPERGNDEVRDGAQVPRLQGSAPRDVGVLVASERNDTTIPVNPCIRDVEHTVWAACLGKQGRQ